MTLHLSQMKMYACNTHILQASVYIMSILKVVSQTVEYCLYL